VILADKDQEVFDISTNDTFTGIPATTLYGQPDFAMSDAQQVEPRQNNCYGPDRPGSSGGDYQYPESVQGLDGEMTGCGPKYALFRSLIAMVDLWAFNMNLESLSFPTYNSTTSESSALRELLVFALDVASLAGSSD